MERAKIFISYRSKDPDLSLATAFSQSFEETGHEVFMAAESLRLGDDWPDRIDVALEQCDFFLLLLSENAASSGMVTEEVRRAKELRDSRPSHKPRILPIRVNLPLDRPLNYDLRGYLYRIQQRVWQSSDDTQKLLREILDLIAEDTPQAPLEDELLPPPNYRAIFNHPVPVAEPELPEGQVAIASAYYIERYDKHLSSSTSIEKRCCDEIKKPWGLIHIKAPRQMGKTSLMARILHFARQKEQMYDTLPLSFQLVNAEVCTDLDKLLRWFCLTVGRKLRLPNQVNDYWGNDDWMGNMDICNAYFTEYLLPSIDKPLVIGMDEVDRLFETHKVAEEFFSLIRGWHEQSKGDALWQKLRFVLVYSTESYTALDVNHSPFGNVGLGVTLDEFEKQQIMDLAERHGLRWEQDQNQELMKLIGGHPYLVRVALYTLAFRNVTFDEFIRDASTEAGQYGDHLRRLYWIVKKDSDLSAALRAVVYDDGPVSLKPELAFRLESLGLVKLQGDHAVARCELYRKYFRGHLR